MGEAQRQPSILGREGIFQRIMRLRLYIALEKHGLLPGLPVHAYLSYQSRGGHSALGRSVNVQDTLLYV